MKALVFSSVPNQEGRKVLQTLGRIFPGHFHRVETVFHPRLREVCVCREDDESSAEVQQVLTSIPEAREVTDVPWDAFVANRQKEGIIPEGWPQTIH